MPWLCIVTVVVICRMTGRHPAAVLVRQTSCDPACSSIQRLTSRWLGQQVSYHSHFVETSIFLKRCPPLFISRQTSFHLSFGDKEHFTLFNSFQFSWCLSRTPNMVSVHMLSSLSHVFQVWARLNSLSKVWLTRIIDEGVVELLPPEY